MFVGGVKKSVTINSQTRTTKDNTPRNGKSKEERRDTQFIMIIRKCLLLVLRTFLNFCTSPLFYDPFKV